jgi:hypothetical protein
LPRQHNVIFNKNEALAVVAKCAACQITTLTTYFAYNAQHADGRSVVYADFPVNHVWKIREKVWSVRQQGEKAIGRMYFVHPAASECFFLRLLLIIILGATSFEHLRAVDDIEHPTFQDACEALGLLLDDAEWYTCMREACIDQDAKGISFVTFIILLSFESKSVMGKISRQYVARYTTSTHHKWRNYRGCLQ